MSNVKDMQRQIREILGHIIQPKIILFASALYNFISLRLDSQNGCAGIACPWYYEWSYLNEPSLLLLSASFLLFSKWRSNIISFLLSGFILVKGIFSITRVGGWLEWLDVLSRRWQFAQEYEIEILKEWETQLILAFIVFSFTAFHLIRDSVYKKTVQNGLI